MRHYDEGQVNQGKVLNNCCYVTSALGLPLRGSRYYIFAYFLANQIFLFSINITFLVYLHIIDIITLNLLQKAKRRAKINLV